VIAKWAALAIAALFALGVNAADAEKPTLADVLEQEEQAGTPGAAAPDTDTGTAAAAPGPRDVLDRDTPRSAVRGFIAAAREGDYERAAEYLDLRNLPRGFNASNGARYARHLKIVLDRELWIDLERLSNDPKGHREDRLPSYRDWVGAIDLDGTPVDILLQRVPLEAGDYGWKFSNATVSKIPDLYAAYGYGEVGEWLSTTLPEAEFLGLYLWQWVMVVGLLVVAFAIAWLPTALIALMLRRGHSPFSLQFAALVSGPLRLLIMVVIFRNWFEFIHPSVTARAIAEGQLLLVVAVAWGFLRTIDIFRSHLSARMEARGAKQASVLLRPAANILKIVIIIGAAVVYLENLGFRATTLIAGLGIGGIAIALAAQKSVENLIGAITLVASAPVRVGDFCRFGDKMGIVQDIGLRWTRIRSLDRTLIHVPNASFADMQLENFADRDKVLFRPQLRLRYDTSPDQIRYILVEAKKMLAAHPKVDPDPARIRFTGFGTHALELNFFSYVTTSDYNEYLEIAEDLHLRIMDIVAEAGAALAVPTQSVLVEQSGPPDAERARAAEQKVQAWRDDNELYVPRAPDEKLEELRGTLRYPPKGSASTEAT